MVQVGLVERGENSRWYEHPVTGQQLESITHVIGACSSKPWLQDWSAKLAGTWCYDNYVLVGHNMAGKVSREAMIALISAEAKRKREHARDLGSHVHHIIESLLLGTPTPQFEGWDVDEQAEIWAVAEGFMNFFEDFEPEMLQSEATVADPVLGIAGTLDFGLMLKRLNGRRIMVDAKSGKELDAGIIAQMGGYWNCPEAWLPTGLVVQALKYDGAAILHLRPEYRRGYKLLLLDDEQLKTGYEWLLQMREQYRHAQAHPKLLGTVIYPALPDGSQPRPWLDDINGWGRARSALIAAGYAHLDELVNVPAGRLLAKKGIGDATVRAVAEMLAAFPGGTT